MDTATEYLACEQQERSRRRAAKGQCPDCGAFRLDGTPPTVHRYLCTRGPDGEQVGAVLATLVKGMNPQRRPKLETPKSKANAHNTTRHGKH